MRKEAEPEEKWVPKDYTDSELQKWLNEMGAKSEALILEKTKSGIFTFSCKRPPAILNINPGTTFEYKKRDNSGNYKIINLPGRSYGINIFHLNGWLKSDRIQWSEKFGWHYETNQIEAISAGATGSAWNEFRFNSARDFYDLIGYLDQAKPIEI